MIIANMVTRPQREHTSEHAVMSIINDVDQVNICFNGYDKPPIWAAHHKINYYVQQTDIGAKGMFYFSKSVYECYFLIIGDDMIYHEGYVKKIIDGIDKYDRKAVVSLQGSIKENYTTKVSYHKTKPLEEDTPCNVLGTGIMGYHTSLIRFDMDQIQPPNYVDVNIGIQAQKKYVPMICLAHTGEEVTYFSQGSDSLSFEKSRDMTTQKGLIESIEWKVYGCNPK